MGAPAYWAQWSPSEIMSMHGVELGGCHDDDDQDHDDCQDDSDDEEHCCSGCMDCLGLSWRDFM